jgi:hypothetical protein
VLSNGCNGIAPLKPGFCALALSTSRNSTETIKQKLQMQVILEKKRMNILVNELIYFILFYLPA